MTVSNISSDFMLYEGFLPGLPAKSAGGGGASCSCLDKLLPSVARISLVRPLVATPCPLFVAPSQARCNRAINSLAHCYRGVAIMPFAILTTGLRCCASRAGAALRAALAEKFFGQLPLAPCAFSPADHCGRITSKRLARAQA